jgi:hypothetical protein
MSTLSDFRTFDTVGAHRATALLICGQVMTGAALLTVAVVVARRRPAVESEPDDS